TQGDDLTTLMTGLRPDGLRQRVGHGSMVEGPQEPTPAVHRQIAGRPYGRGARVARQDGLGGGQLIDHPGDVLRMTAGPGPDGRQLIEVLSLSRIVLPGRRQMPVVLVDSELG